MADTIHYVDPQWLPSSMRDLTWTTLNDHTLVRKGTILFDPRFGYAGEVMGLSDGNGHYYYNIHWYKDPTNTIPETFTLAQMKAYADKGCYYWADPCMQEG